MPDAGSSALRFVRGLLLTLGGAALYLATFDSDMFAPDDLQRYRLAMAIADKGPAALSHSGFVSKYPPLLSILAAIPVRIARWFEPDLSRIWSHRLTISISLMACVALIPLFLAMARAVGLSERAAGLATLLFLLTNPLWPYSKRFYSESLSAALTLGAVTGLFIHVRQNRKGPLIAGLCCFLLLPLNNMVVPVGLGIGLLTMAFVDGRRWRLMALVAGTDMLGAMLALGMAYIRFGKFGAGGYDGEGFKFKIVDAIHGLIFGPGRSIFLFAPLTFLALFGWRALARIDRGLVRGALATAFIVFGINACWWAWYGGVCFGPRLMLPVLPLLSLGALPLLRRATPLWTGAAVLVGIFGLYVQILGVAFKQDYDIYYYLDPQYHNEHLAWFDPAHSDLVRIPRHFVDQPWDFSSDYLTLHPSDPSTIAIDNRPTKMVRITQRKDAQFSWWSITDIFAVVRDANGERRVPAGQLGAVIETYNHSDGQGAMDGNPRTRWTTGVRREDGMWVQLDFDQVHEDIVRLELTHMPNKDDFPTALEAKISTGDGNWTEVPAVASTPKLEWSPLILVFFLSGLVLLLAGALLPEPKEEPDPDPVPAI